MEQNTKQTPFFDPPNMVIAPEHMVFPEPTNLSENIWIIDNCLSPEMCQEIIVEFEKHKLQQYDGMTGSGVNKEVKDSKDLLLSDMSISIEKAKEIDEKMFHALHTSTASVLQKLINYPCFIGWSPDQTFHHDTGYQIQKTVPGGRYVWHIENAQSNKCFETGMAARTLTYIIYLNTVNEDDGGSTGFLYQRLKVQPRAGRIVLFPPYWTHVHAGYPLLAGSKYIATGWFYSDAHKF